MDDLELTAVMNQLDVDNSGDVQFEEFEKWWQGTRERNLPF